MRLLLPLIPLLAFAAEYPAQPSTYTLPGIVGKGGSGWIGTDHLLNVPAEIHVIAEIVKPADLTVDIDTSDIRTAVLQVFEKDGFPVNFEQKDAGPPLPFFDILVLIQKIEGGFAVSIAGRLFEEVDVNRVVLPDEVTFQAITWEKENLLVIPKDQLKGEILNTTREIARIFASRYRFFERQKLKLS